jgi:TPP-dependent pyruvate/acetoin dehydrogenase alpha subunit
MTVLHENLPGLSPAARSSQPVFTMARNAKPHARGVSKPRIATAPARREKPDNGSKLLGPKKLKQLYSTMLRCRMVREKARILCNLGNPARNHLDARGLEAVEVGALIDLLPRDCISCGRRELSAGYIRGTPLEELFRQLFDVRAAAGAGDALSPVPGQLGAGILASASTLAARTNISAGVALSFKMQKRPNVVVAFSGDDATLLNSWRESVQFAVAHKLPIVHVVQNDLGTEPAGPKLQASGQESQASPPAPGIPTLVVDGTDAVAVYRVSQEAIRRAREGHGPALIECKSQRWAGHSEIGLSAPSPSQDQKPHPDPLVFMETYLRERGVWSEAWKDRLVKTFKRELETAVKSAERASRVKAVS